MPSLLGRYVLAAREKLGLSRPETVKLAGWKNINKGMRNLQQLEEDGACHPDHLLRFAAALNLDHGLLRDCIERDQRAAKEAFEKWVSEPQEPFIIVRYMAAIYVRKEIPPEVLRVESDLCQYASAYAQSTHFYVCLMLSRETCIWFDNKGVEYHRSVATPEMPDIGPNVRIGGKKFPTLDMLLGPSRREE
ncbi:MAG: hypothetical protein L6Q71_05780 [Planctomycetes bacterium]|nr:hypothetical protein [Planctomycetota bacterium]NUQ36060.1 hypothetical protein [Planctomycetaceae bacterium]